jgi:hypothetical protein
MDFAPGTIVVDDRGYNDYRLFAKWTDAQVFFLTRMKDNAQFEVLEERDPPQNRRILKDQTIRLTGVGAQEKCSHRLRRIEALREDTGEVLVFLTNHHGLGANLGKMLSLPVVFVLQYLLNSRITFYKKTLPLDSNSIGGVK